jgi:hypothetical protein
MSTEHHSHRPVSGNGRPVHQDVSFEPRDVRVSPILKFLFWLGVTIVLSYVLTVGIYAGLTHFWAENYAKPLPTRLAAGPEVPPEPRLQGMPGHLADAQQDLRDKLKADAEANDKLGWIDQKAGIVRIPVSDVMQLIVEKGLSGATPPAEKK